LPGLEIILAEEHESRIAVSSLVELEHFLVTRAPSDAIRDLIKLHKVNVEA